MSSPPPPLPGARTPGQRPPRNWLQRNLKWALPLFVLLIVGGWSLTSWMTCMVQSAVHGAAVAVLKSGVRIMSGSVNAPWGLSAHSPVMVCRKIEFGR